jgi:hypothetical protein
MVVSMFAAGAAIATYAVWNIGRGLLTGRVLQPRANWGSVWRERTAQPAGYWFGILGWTIFIMAGVAMVTIAATANVAKH